MGVRRQWLFGIRARDPGASYHFEVARRISGELALPNPAPRIEDDGQSEGRGSAGAWLLPLTGLAGQALLSAPKPRPLALPLKSCKFFRHPSCTGVRRFPRIDRQCGHHAKEI